VTFSPCYQGAPNVEARFGVHPNTLRAHAPFGMVTCPATPLKEVDYKISSSSSVFKLNYTPAILPFSFRRGLTSSGKIKKGKNRKKEKIGKGRCLLLQLFKE